MIYSDLIWCNFAYSPLGTAFNYAYKGTILMKKGEIIADVMRGEKHLIYRMLPKPQLSKDMSKSKAKNLRWVSQSGSEWVSEWVSVVVIV